MKEPLVRVHRGKATFAAGGLDFGIAGE